MNKINKNNLENLKALYGAYQTKKAVKEEKKEEVKQAQDYQPKEVEANVLDVIAAQNKAAQFVKPDTSDAATQKRLEQAFANSAFMKSLDEMQGFEGEDFVAFAMANATGVNHDKLAKYLNKPLSADTIAKVEGLTTIIA